MSTLRTRKIDKRHWLSPLLAVFALVAMAFVGAAPAPAAAFAPAADATVVAASDPAAEAVVLATREENALAWARSVIGDTHTNGDLGAPNEPWENWCDKFVAHAYGRSSSGYYTALDHFHALNARGLIHTDANPPAGALVFYDAAPVNDNFGHVMLSEGDGNFITTAAQISRVSISWPGAPYLGWSWADPEWPGR